MSYYQKYLKYKQKYLELQNQIAGTDTFIENFNIIIDEIDKIQSEFECCFKDLSDFSHKSNLSENEKKYLMLLIDNYTNMIQNTAKYIENTNNKNKDMRIPKYYIRPENFNIEDSNIEQLEVANNKYIKIYYPLIYKIFKEYLQFLTKFKEDVTKEKLPFYSIDGIIRKCGDQKIKNNCHLAFEKIYKDLTNKIITFKNSLSMSSLQNLIDQTLDNLSAKNKEITNLVEEINKLTKETLKYPKTEIIKKPGLSDIKFQPAGKELLVANPTSPIIKKEPLTSDIKFQPAEKELLIANPKSPTIKKEPLTSDIKSTYYTNPKSLLKNINNIRLNLRRTVFEFKCCLNDLKKLDRTKLNQAHEKFLNILIDHYSIMVAEVNKLSDKINLKKEITYGTQKDIELGELSILQDYINLYHPILISVLDAYLKFITNFMNDIIRAELPFYSVNVIRKEECQKGKHCCDKNIKTNCYEFSQNQISLMRMQLYENLGNMENFNKYLKKYINATKEKLDQIVNVQEKINKYMTDNFCMYDTGLARFVNVTNNPIELSKNKCDTNSKKYDGKIITSTMEKSKIEIYPQIVPKQELSPKKETRK